ncbi:hypothetical protein LTR62_007688 [Meristemomyces frigidus]|uniref:PUM-HD domain-containing protein n=1 Tax=Meristemomyces frigidus TaxID=1508187 RepID=A0AAN7YDA6_9PEZI|nr:hypothetical protein LTR62_007688 [Meristemomyces frigidus]
MAYYFRQGQSPRDEHQVPTYSNPLSPQRNPNRLSGGMIANNPARNGMTRRFTTNEMPTLSPIGQQRKQAAGDYMTNGFAKMIPVQTEERVRHYEQLLARQRQIQAELAAVDPETRREVDQGLLHEESIAAMMAASEPSSPPEYGNAFPNAFSKPNRYSSASLASVPGITNRASRSSTQLTSPSAGHVRPYTSGNIHLPSQSTPGSRRQSDDEDEDDFIYGFDTAIHRAAANPNRNSMPITGYNRKRNTTDFSTLAAASAASYHYEENENGHQQQTQSNTTSPPTARAYLQVLQTADGFPKLIRREDHVDLSSSALDLALAQGVEPHTQLADRATASRHRISLPPSALSSNFSIAPLNSILANAEGKLAQNNRRSMEVKFSAETKRPSIMATPPRPAANGTMSKMPSYSTNDVPTLKSINSEAAGGIIRSPIRQPAGKTEASSETDLGHLITATGSTQQSRDLASAIIKSDDGSDSYATPTTSGLQASAQPFGFINGNYQDSVAGSNGGQNVMSPYAQPQFYPGYNMPMLNNGFANMGVGGYGGQPQWAGQMGGYGQQNGYGGYQQQFSQPPHTTAGAGRYGAEGQRAQLQQRRQAQEEAQARFSQITVDQLIGEIYGLCKDQHGCRFLQRKLDERADNAVQIIFEEIKDHIIELMTDPFGNYLCQKLLECTNDTQRTVLIRNAAPAMTSIALNQHGTRALQKMIEYITTPEQTEIIIQALRFDVVQLIQDLNGNHVIQKCLNHLSPENAQFIFDAVGAHCVIVGTHRHGCCVLQRCIDHASGLQKGALVDHVINNAFNLVQDPFGNYVVQYILDLSEATFTEPLCRSFAGQVAYLSKQKFSSNVVEKCIRCASNETRRSFVEEITVPHELDKLLRDSFANYVVQTAMDYADEQTKRLLIDNIRPILPAIRHTPYGRRIGTKIAEYDARLSTASSAAASGAPSGAPSGVATPTDVLSPVTINSVMNGVSPYATAQIVPSGGRANRHGWAGPPPQWGGITNGVGPPVFNNHNSNFNPPNGYANNDVPSGTASPTPQRHSQGNNSFAGANEVKTFVAPVAFNRY